MKYDVSDTRTTGVCYCAGGTVLRVLIRAMWRIFHWSGNQSDSWLIFAWGRFINSCVRYNCGSTSWRRQLLVKLAKIAAVRPPRGLPTNKEFLRLSTTRFISRSLHIVIDGHGAISQEHVQRLPLAERVVHCFGHGMLRQ